ncbi:MAG: restriction endonuclease subunit S [Cycloclasticus sp.]
MMDVLATAPKYGLYKETGIEWLSEIPAEWNVEKAKWLFFKAERPVNKGDEIVTCFRDGQVTLRSKRRTEGFTNALKEHGYQGIRKGDLVIHAMDAFAGAIGISDSDGKSTPVYAACVPRMPNIVNPSFYAYYMRDLALSGFIVSLAKGIRERSTDFRFNDFAQLPLPLPSLSVQDKIVSFLDTKTAQIDEAISIKQKQIVLLKERKQIIIQKAVTQGLNPDVPMKDSGVDWIGQIPQHWKVEKLFGLCRFVRGNSAFAKDELLSNGQYVALQYGKTYKVDEIDESYEFYVNEEFYKETQVVSYGDVIFISTSETIEDLGHSAIYNREEVGLTGGEQILIKPNNELLDHYYIYYSTKVFSKELRKYATGIKVFRFNINDLKTIYTAFPPKEEQREIALHISTQSKKIDETISLQESQIEKLQEYKTTLINSAVTGKIKVA